MKLKCIRNWITDPNGYERDLSEYLTIGKIYYISKFFEPCSEWVYCIIDEDNFIKDSSEISSCF